MKKIIVLLIGLFFIQAEASFFKGSYFESRSQFLELAKKVPHQEIRSFSIPSAEDKELFMDVAYFPVENTTKLVILNSGIHGVEGFVGSALQSYFIEKYLLNQPQASRNFSVVMIHAMNPYGFKNLRRVDENNVDLNRNFAILPDLFNEKNPAYSQVYDLLNPEGVAEIGWLTKTKFLFTAIYNIVKYSMESLRRSVLMGQYEHPKGIYFGGQQFSAQKQIIEPLLVEEIKKYQQILLVDVHTGYGERGRLHLFAESGPDMSNDNLIKIFPNTPIDFGNQKNFYEVKGSFNRYVAQLTKQFNAQSKYAAVAFEFGTLNSQTTLGSLDSIHRMILENEGVHFGYADQDSRLQIQSDFREMFYPSDLLWQKEAILQFDQNAKSIVDHF